MPYRLKRREPVAEAVRRIAHEEIDRGLLAAESEGRPFAQRVHDARTSCKRLRGLLRLVRPTLGETFDRENAFVRDVARHLSAARDAAIVLDAFEDLARRGAKHVAAESLAAVRAALAPCAAGPRAENREEHHARLIAYADSLRDLRERSDEWRIDACGFDAVEDGLHDAYETARDAMRTALDSPDPADRHEWRKAAKYHWYHVRLLRGAWKPALQARADELERLSDLLGDDHDLVLLRESLGALPGCDPAHVDPVVALVERRTAKLRGEAAPLGARLFAEKPKAFTRRFRRYWKAWRGKT